MNPTLESIEMGAESSIKLHHYKCKAFQHDHSLHFHPEFELSYIVSGSGNRIVGDSSQPFRSGELVFIGPNTPHCWMSDDNQSNNEMLVLQFTQDCFGHSFWHTPEATRIRSLFSEAKRGIYLSGDKAQLVKFQLMKLSKYQGLSRISEFIKLLDTLSQFDEKKLLASEYYYNGSRPGRLGKIIQFIQDNLACDIKQTHAAEVACMTPQSFSRFFKSKTGKTFINFVNEMRINEACKLLINTEKDIVSIAFETGYSNTSYFNRRFALLKQRTPAEYRKINKSGT